MPVFTKLRNDFQELFPKEDPDLFYIPPSENDNNEAKSARGGLYNHYRIVRKDLRDARILKLVKTSITLDENNESQWHIFNRCILNFI